MTELELFIACAVLVAYYFIDNKQSIYEVLKGIEPVDMAAILFSYTIYLVLSSWSILVSHDQFIKLKASFVTITFINSSSSVMGFLLPSGATPTKLFLLKYFFSETKVSVLAVVARVTNSFLLTSSLIALTTCFLLYSLQTIVVNQTLLKIVISAALLCLIFTVAMSSRVLCSKKKLTSISRQKIGFKSVQYNSLKQIGELGLLSTSQILLFTFSMWVYFQDTDISAIVCLFLISINNITMILPLTPGNLGIREGIYYYIGPQIGIDPHMLVSISLIDRVVQLVFFSTISLLLYSFSSKQK